MSNKKPETPTPAVEHIELDEVQLDAAVGGAVGAIVPCVKDVPCIKTFIPCVKNYIPCIKTPRG